MIGLQRGHLYSILLAEHSRYRMLSCSKHTFILVTLTLEGNVRLFKYARYSLA
jgi:hypothetical protein